MAIEETWARRIRKARNRGNFTGDDIKLASSFTTCAVGETLKGKSRYGLGLEVGDALFCAGVDFYYAVYYGQAKQALKVYKHIQDLVKGK